MIQTERPRTPTRKLPLAPHYPGGLLTGRQLRQLADIAEHLDASLKLSNAGISLLGLTSEERDYALAELQQPAESFISPTIRAVTMCTGKPHCPRALQDSTEMGLALDQEFFGRELPGKLRIAISGCPNCCSEVFVRDIGLYGTPSGYMLVVGGNAGRQAAIARPVAHSITSDQLLPLITQLLAYYVEHGKDKERLGSTLDRTGWSAFISAVIPVQNQIPADKR